MLINTGRLERDITIELEMLFLSFGTVTIKEDVDEVAFDVCVKEAEEKQTLVDDQLRTTPLIMRKTPDIPSLETFRETQAAKKLLDMLDGDDHGVR